MWLCVCMCVCVCVCACSVQNVACQTEPVTGRILWRALLYQDMFYYSFVSYLFNIPWMCAATKSWISSWCYKKMQGFICGYFLVLLATRLCNLYKYTSVSTSEEQASNSTIWIVSKFWQIVNELMLYTWEFIWEWRIGNVIMILFLLMFWRILYFWYPEIFMVDTKVPYYNINRFLTSNVMQTIFIVFECLIFRYLPYGQLLYNMWWGAI